MVKINVPQVAKTGHKFSKGLIADLKTNDMENGKGVRTTLFVEGCIFNCFNCFNSRIQDFKAGLKEAEDKKQGLKPNVGYPKYFDDEVMDDIIESLKPSYINGITLLGGEPFLNTNVTLPVATKVREVYGNSKTIWSWTGYTWEELTESIECGYKLSLDQYRLLSKLDILVDGRYEDDIRKKDLIKNPNGVHFRGSSNQRIINVPESLKQGKVVEATEYYEGEILD